MWPASDTKVRILGPELKPVRNGTGGPIYISGSDLAPFNRPDPQNGRPQGAGGVALAIMLLFVGVVVPVLGRVH
jgi:hypothetical protein